MFKKLLKYDMRSIWKTARLLLPIEIVLSVLVGIALHFVISDASEDSSLSSFFNFADLSLTVASVFAIFGMIVLLAVIGILVYYRFYSNFYSDQGYLTFSLPIDRKTLFIEKIIFGVIWEAIMLVTGFIMLAIILAIAPPFTVNGSFGFPIYHELGNLISLAWKESGAWMLLDIPFFIIQGVLLMTFSILFAYLCITLGAVIFQKHKLLGAIGLYVGISTAFAIISEMLTFLVADVLLENPKLTDWYVSLPTAGRNLLELAFSILISAILAAVCYVIYRITLKKIRKKLNLA